MHLHPALGYRESEVDFIKPLIIAQGIQISKVNVINTVSDGETRRHVQYVINTNITTQTTGHEKVLTRSDTFSVPEEYPSLIACPTFYKKHVIGIPSDLSVGPTDVSATVNTSSVYEICIEGVEDSYPNAVDVGFLDRKQCTNVFDWNTVRTRVGGVDVPPTPGFNWCCGQQVWSSLPPAFKGRCGVCTLNDLLYVVEPTEYIPTSQKRSKRDSGGPLGYVHLSGPKTQDLHLPDLYHDLPIDFQIYQRQQLVFKSIFWNTQLQYANHYLIALTRHDLYQVANSTLMGFQALGSEIALIRQFAIHSRIALDALTAAQGGVCAVVGDDACCTYLPSVSEGLGNLTAAISNLKNIQQGITRINTEVRRTGGFTDSSFFGSIASLFTGNPVMAWLLGFGGPIIVVILIVLAVVGCCFPILKALILKSLQSVANISVVTQPHGQDLEKFSGDTVSYCDSISVNLDCQ